MQSLKEKKKLEKSGRDGGVGTGTIPLLPLQPEPSLSTVSAWEAALPSLPGARRVKSESGTHVGMMRKGLTRTP